MNKTQFCQICKESNRPTLCPGFLVSWGTVQLDECPFCKNKNLITFDISEDDILIIGKISSNSDFIEAMIKLKQDDIIEYQSRMAQFKTQVEQQNRVVKDNVPKCPVCGSTNINKITLTNRIIKTSLFGAIGAVDDAGKTYKCGNCGSKF